MKRFWSFCGIGKILGIMKNQHRRHSGKAAKEYESLRQLSTKLNLKNSLPEVYFSGLLIRICETLESIFHNANGEHDNTLLILFRHLYENVVRIRYLALDPNKGALEFELMEMRGHLGIIGRDPKPFESEETKINRQKYIEIEEVRLCELRKLYETPEGKNPPNLNVERMCKLVNMEETYTVYRLFSQFEHSTGVGLMGTVLNKDTQRVAKGNKLSDSQIETLWDAVVTMMVATEEGIEMLNQNRIN